ncbi:MAG: hypothetical protein HPY53_01475 [Brevinematales bacterium]|nr:hypothetical protein [Brevinematales bacterium]
MKNYHFLGVVTAYNEFLKHSVFVFKMEIHEFLMNFLKESGKITPDRLLEIESGVAAVVDKITEAAGLHSPFSLEKTINMLNEAKTMLDNVEMSLNIDCFRSFANKKSVTLNENVRDGVALLMDNVDRSLEHISTSCGLKR